MDDIARQNIAEDQYKDIKNQGSFEKYEGDYKSKHYTNIHNNAITQTIVTQTKGYMTEYETKFDGAAKDFWKEIDPAVLTKYQTGETVCSFNNESLTVHGYFSRIFQMIKESIIIEMSQSGQTTEELKSAFDMVSLSLKVLADQIVKSKKDVNVTSLISFMHGFVNTYIRKNIKGK